jgi:phosphohistidine phosphatase
LQGESGDLQSAGETHETLRNDRSFIVEFYLVRHGEAVSELADPRRPLTAAGRLAVDRVARLALARRLRVSTILHSGILRAQQTAEILAGHLAPQGGVQPMTGLLPEDDPAISAAELSAAQHPVILVGHLPHLARLAGLLVRGDCEREIIQFEPAVMACLRRKDSEWTLDWTLAP